jgi:flagellar motility protein MotE (MotC chaperone)
MKSLETLRKILGSGKKIVILMLFFLLFKLSLVGYFVSKSERLSYAPFLKQAIAQEKEMETKEAETSGDISAEEEFSSLTLLEKKRKELEGKEEELKQKEERLDQLKTEIEERLEKLAQMEKKIEKLIALKETEEAKDLTKLAKVFEATPPEQAGPMFNKLDVKIAAKILVRMKGRSAGKIWGYVDPDQAVKISKELTKLK